VLCGGNSEAVKIVSDKVGIKIKETWRVVRDNVFLYFRYERGEEKSIT
jgi:hypothetical protein